MIALWYWVVHVMGCDYTAPYGHWVWYDWWSGITGSFLVGLTVWFFGFYIHHTCHDHLTCLRWGKYPAAGGLFKLCRRHHPDLRGQRPHHELIHRLHSEHLARISGRRGLR